MLPQLSVKLIVKDIVCSTVHRTRNIFECNFIRYVWALTRLSNLHLAKLMQGYRTVVTCMAACQKVVTIQGCFNVFPDNKVL